MSYNVPIGEALGNFSNELGTDDFITEFTSMGPKAYCYKTFAGKECVKLKGFNLNFENSQRINAETMKKLIDGKISVITKNFEIRRDKKTKNVFSKNSKKRLVFGYNKRYILEDNYSTLPYGTV